MSKIRPEDFEEAFERWRDFVNLQPVNEDAMDEREAEIEAGEMTKTEALLADDAEADHDVTIQRLDAVRESVGIGLDAKRTFVRGLAAQLSKHPVLPKVPEGAGAEEVIQAIDNAWAQKADTAALIGLVVGLMARQLADERPGS